VEVVARSGFSSLRLGSALISDNGSWTMEVSASKLERGGNIVVFDYDNERMTEWSYSIQVGDVDDGSRFGWIIWAVLSVVVIALLGGVFVFFFVEFEEEDDDESLLMPEGVQEAEDVYAWGKQEQEQQPAAQPAAQAVAQPEAQPAYPGWQWDAASNQWIPDQSGGPPQQ
jgi:hypothetical protein